MSELRNHSVYAIDALINQLLSTEQITPYVASVIRAKNHDAYTPETWRETTIHDLRTLIHPPDGASATPVKVTQRDRIAEAVKRATASQSQMIATLNSQLTTKNDIMTLLHAQIARKNATIARLNRKLVVTMARLSKALEAANHPSTVTTSAVVIAED